ncbi:hypothetical protein F5Y13DRAFT_191904 [Hypoxylon sp. FL1857]|nr:hypothetical protein F5Y13DRAFT_191904 [Hypoxylon sp. FL1857]
MTMLGQTGAKNKEFEALESQVKALGSRHKASQDEIEVPDLCGGSLVRRVTDDIIFQLLDINTLEALRVYGDAKRGFSITPNVLKQNLLDTGLGWLLQPPGNVVKAAFWRKIYPDNKVPPQGKQSNMLYDMNLVSDDIKGNIDATIGQTIKQVGVMLANAQDSIVKDIEESPTSSPGPNKNRSCVFAGEVYHRKEGEVSCPIVFFCQSS